MNGTPNDHRRRVGLPPSSNDVEIRGNDVDGHAYDPHALCVMPATKGRRASHEWNAKRTSSQSGITAKR